MMREIKHKHRVMAFAGYGIQLAEILSKSKYGGKLMYTYLDWIPAS